MLHILTDKREAVIKDGNQERFVFEKGEDITVPCKPTHPDVVMSLKRTTQLAIGNISSVNQQHRKWRQLNGSTISFNIMLRYLF
jgi:hypothetical protein